MAIFLTNICFNFITTSGCLADMVIVCRYGDSVTSAHMPGDGFRLRHDGVKMKIKSLLQWAGVRAECEVFNEFAGLIPQQGLNRIQRGQRRQGLVPDFKLEGERGGEDQLCELKIMSASRSRYPRNPLPRDGVRAVDRRAAVRERQAQSIGFRQGRSIRRLGFGFLDV